MPHVHIRIVSAIAIGCASQRSKWKEVKRWARRGFVTVARTRTDFNETGREMDQVCVCFFQKGRKKSTLIDIYIGAIDRETNYNKAMHEEQTRENNMMKSKKKRRLPPLSVCRTRVSLRQNGR